MKHLTFRLFVNAGLLALALTHTALHAQPDRLPSEPNFFTWGELALLPEYCRDTQGVLYQVHGNGQDSPRAPYWLSLMGSDFWHMHHYCYALAYIMRSEQPSMTPQQKKYLYLRAISDYNYVIKNASPSMALMPEVHYKVGELYLLMDNPGLASEQFARARRLKADYWPAYTRWADVLASLKRYDDALALVREGQFYAPDAKELQKRAAKFEAAGGRAAPLKKMAAVTPTMNPAAPTAAASPTAASTPTSPPAAAPAPALPTQAPAVEPAAPAAASSAASAASDPQK